MSQLPDKIFVPEISKYGTLDYVIAYLDLDAAKEEGYEKEEVQGYVPTYRFLELAAMVEEMRKAQKVYNEMFPTGNECYAPVEYERKVDDLLKEIKQIHPEDMED